MHNYCIKTIYYFYFILSGIFIILKKITKKLFWEKAFNNEEWNNYILFLYKFDVIDLRKMHVYEWCIK
jgi:hypothetical protein